MQKQHAILVAACALFGASAAAQTQSIYLPAGLDLDKRFGNWAMSAPFEEAPARMQQVFLASEVAKVSASLTSVAVRGKPYTAPIAGVMLQNFTVDVGYATTDPERMSVNYNGNRGAVTTVQSGSFALPNIMPNSSPTDFQIQIPFKTPFAYDVTKGSLLLDMINNDSYRYGGWRYELDSIPSGSGVRSQIGMCAQFPSGGGCPVYSVNRGLAAPSIGETADLDVFDLPGAYPTFAVVGTSHLSWNGIKLPLDLQPFGAAPGSKLWVSAEVLLPMTTYMRTAAPYPNRHAARLQVPVPNDPKMVGARLLTQAFAMHGSGGGLSVTSSEGWFLIVGAKKPGTQLVSSPWSSGNGFYFQGGRGGSEPYMYGGAAVRWQGTFR